jgi:hypothetical protein
MNIKVRIKVNKSAKNKKYLIMTYFELKNYFIKIFTKFENNKFF